MNLKPGSSELGLESLKYKGRSRSNSLETEGSRLEQSTVASAYSTINNPSSFSPNHPRNFRPIQVFLHSCWARSNYEMDFDEEELPLQVNGNLTFSSMYKRVQTEDGEWKENTVHELQATLALNNSSQVAGKRKISQNFESIQELKPNNQTRLDLQEGNLKLELEDYERSPLNRPQTQVTSQSENESSEDQESWGISTLNPEVDIPTQVLDEAVERFARLKRKRKHPRILRLIKEERAITDKMKIDGSVMKSSKQPNSPESPKRDYLSKSSRFKYENLLKLNKSPLLSDENISRHSSDKQRLSFIRSDSDTSSQAPTSPMVPPTPGTPQFTQYQRGAKTYDKFLEAQLEKRAQQQRKQTQDLAQFIEGNLTGEAQKPRSVTMGGMDSAMALRMNKNRKNLPTKGNDKMKLGNLMNSKIFMRRTQSQNSPEGESMLTVCSRQQSQQKATSEKSFTSRKPGLVININRSSRKNEVKRI